MNPRSILITDETRISTDGVGLIIHTPGQPECGLYCTAVEDLDKLVVGIELYRQVRELEPKKSVIPPSPVAVPLPRPGKIRQHPPIRYSRDDRCTCGKPFIHPEHTFLKEGDK